jgi:hypothetical protein
MPLVAMPPIAGTKLWMCLQIQTRSNEYASNPFLCLKCHHITPLQLQAIRFGFAGLSGGGKFIVTRVPNDLRLRDYTFDAHYSLELSSGLPGSAIIWAQTYQLLVPDHGCDSIP